MAGLWFSVIVLIFVENVLSNVCENESSIPSCDECIRCGGNWCSQKKNDHCTLYMADDFCDASPEPLTVNQVVSNMGDLVDPQYYEKTLFIGRQDSMKFSYNSPVSQNVSLSIFNSTQQTTRGSQYNIQLETDEPSQCDGRKCTLNIKVKALPGFCSNTSTNLEFVYVKIKVSNMNDEALLKFHVPCACECSAKVERKSAKCHGHGDFTCGVCACYKGWSGNNCNIKEVPISQRIELMSPKCNNNGDFSFGLCDCYDGWFGETCNERKCESSRGDVVQCHHPSKPEVCSGNGKCGPCDICDCFTDREGSQYFDRRNYCSDICMDTSDGYDQCLTNGTIGPCNLQTERVHPMTVLEYDEIVAAERDQYNRTIWVGCNDTFTLVNNDTCYVRYVAMKTGDGHYSVMIVESCNTVVIAGRGSEVGGHVPLILGVLFTVAVLAAVGGVVVWKYLNAVPPLPLTDPQYENIDAEDCTGENPLYKPPTSQFKNPTYGKW